MKLHMLIAAFLGAIIGMAGILAVIVACAERDPRNRL